jgi:hypothetical protein
MFKDSMEIFQKVGEIIMSQVNEEWVEVNIEAEIDEDLADLCVWYIDTKMQEKYFNITRDLTESFIQLRKLTSDKEKGMWSKCLFTLTKDGNFKTNFSYDKPRWS